jgi:hypothetical protein
LISNEDIWQQFTYDFRLPPGCTASQQVEVFIANTNSASGGNDYYVDDISLGTLPCSGQPDIPCPSGVLPVQLLNFTTDLNDDDHVTVSWTAVEESGIDNYIIQRSNDGFNFTDIASKTPLNQSLQHTYSVLDNVPDRSFVKLFYRVKIVHAGGNITYSIINMLDTKIASTTLHIYPQPSNGTVTIYWGYKDPVTIQLFDFSGANVLLVRNYSKRSITFDNLRKGTYLVKIISQKSGGLIQTKKMIIN